MYHLINSHSDCRFWHSAFDVFTEARKDVKYMLLIYSDEQAWDETNREHCYKESAQVAQQLHASGQYLAAAPLYSVATATSVRVRDGKPLVIDGPFAETREQLGGYFLIEAQDLDEAISVASRIPAARVGTVEVRPVMEVPGLPEAKSARRTNQSTGREEQALNL